MSRPRERTEPTWSLPSEGWQVSVRELEADASGGLGTPVRRSYIVDAVIEIDEERLGGLVQKAAENMSGRSQVASGGVVVRIVRKAQAAR